MWGKREKRLELPTRKYPAVSVYFRVWVTVWVRTKSRRSHAKQDDEKTSTIFRKICKTQTAQKQGNTVLNRRKAKPSTSRKSKETAQSCGFSDFGGGEWIRTTEVVDNRFTVCPLWPLGNSPINVFNFRCRQPAGISASDFHAVRARLARGGTPLELVNGLEPLTC